VAIFAVDELTNPAVRGFLHVPDHQNGDALVLTHGAGADCNSKLLRGLAETFAESGYTVLRCNLPFRQQRPHGPPFPGNSDRDREGLGRAVEFMKNRARSNGRVFLGGHSYGGRQATMLAAEDPEIAAALLLLSYPLHPPRKPMQLRIAHLPNLRTPSFFVHGTRDPFGSPAEMESALALIPAKHELFTVQGAGHDLVAKKESNDLPQVVVQSFKRFAAAMPLSADNRSWRD